MPEEQPAPAVQQPEQAIPQPASDKFPTSWDEVFQHPRFKELNTKAQQATQELERIKAEEKQKQEEALKEQNKWKELYESTTSDLKNQKVTNLRLKVAASKGLPPELVERLRGDTEEEITKDAESLLEFVRPTESKGVPPSRRNGQAAQVDLLTETDPAKIREAVKQGLHK